MRAFALSSLLILMMAGGACYADEMQEFHLVLKAHRFEPAQLVVPAGQRIKLVVENQDDTPEEFESHTLKREKLVAAGAKISVIVGPLEAGSYDFFGEFNPKTATGKLIAQ